MKKILWILLAGILLAGCSGPRTTQVVAFGSEFSDNGKYYAIAKQLVEDGIWPASDLDGFRDNYEGRMSNGPVAVEVLAKELDVPLQDFAVGTATSGQDTVFINRGVTPFNNTGVLGQIDSFEDQLDGKRADPKALYYIELGFMDFAQLMYIDRNENDQTIADLADQEIANLTTAITRLASLGATQFLVFSLDWSPWPSFALGSPFLDQPGITQGFIDRSNLFLSTMHSKVPTAMATISDELKVDIQVFDFKKKQDAIVNNPGQYGFTDTTHPCKNLPYSSALGCDDPENYYFWGYYYLSGHAHQVLGEMMAEQVKK